MKYTLAIFILLMTAQFYAQKNDAGIQGSWQGTLTTPNGELALVIKIKSENNGITAKLDVPAQRAKDIKASSAWFRNDSLFIEFEMMRARYIGLLKPARQIIGEWEQGSSDLPLTLVPATGLSAVTEVRHPQAPLRPYGYNEEDVVFENAKAKIKLAGTLTWPKNTENCKVAILISGSGPQNRDEELLGQKPFLVLADHLTRNGIAVLRFDDRGVGKSGGDFSKATTLDFATDVEAAIAFLKTRKEINKKMIGLIGHSEGGMIAPLVANRSKDVHFIVLLAGPGIKGSDLLILQSVALSRASGVSQDDIDKNTVLNNKIYQLAASNKPGVQDSVATLLKNAGLPEADVNKQARAVTSEWFKGFLTFDPTTTLSKTKCAVLALNGTKDLQVPYKENLEGIEKNLKKSGNKNYEIKAYPDLNHLFQHSETGLPSEYGQIAETISPEVLRDITDWILKQK